MKQVFITGKKKCEIREVPAPQAKDDWALVKNYVAPMCTEYKQHASGQINHPIGHEAAGEVVEVAQPGKVKVGDRVVVMPQYPCGKCDLCIAGKYIYCENIVDLKTFTGSEFGRSTYAQYILKPSWLLPIIPDDISLEHASMICCGLGPTFGAMERMKTCAGDTVLITGLGPVGLGGVINARYRNCTVIGITKNEYRANLALELGAEKILNPDDPDLEKQIKEITKGKGVSCSIDCSGNPQAQRLMLNVTARNGKVAFVGESEDLGIKVSDDLIRKGLTLYGIWHYNLNGIPKLFKLVRESKTSLDLLITHKFSINDVADAWELQQDRKCGKVLLLPWE
jgi:L-iditol 2-dehydrogenase